LLPSLLTGAPVCDVAYVKWLVYRFAGEVKLGEIVQLGSLVAGEGFNPDAADG
jgi:hypothetical protein